MSTKRIDFYNVDTNDEDAWNLICEGKTLGVFQFESNLGRNWTKKIKPRSIQEASDVSALLRPGCLNSLMNDKSMTQHYLDRKFGNEEAIPICDKISHLMEKTHQIMIYQEQAMEIAKYVAGFSLEQADNLRKAIGKKNSTLMDKVEKEFIIGCSNTKIVTDSEARIIFDNIRESQKYSFNLSHSCSYAFISYWTALAKAKNPTAFICASLNHPGSLDKNGTIRELIYEARSLGITVAPPNVDSDIYKFSIKNGVINYGIACVKGIGDSKAEKLFNGLKSVNKPVNKMTWTELVFLLYEFGDCETVETLIATGYFDFLHEPRMKLIEEYKTFIILSDSVINFFKSVKDECKSVSHMMTKFIYEYENNKKTNKLISRLRDSTYEKVLSNYKLLQQSNIKEDSVDWICRKERELLRTELTYSPLDRVCIVNTNTDCHKIKTIGGENLIAAVEIVDFREYILTKGKQIGKTMCFLTIADRTGCADAVMFSNIYEKFRNFVYEGNLVEIKGKVGEKGSLIIDSLKNL